MCFTIDDNHPESIIAQEDIKCYKVVNVLYNSGDIQSMHKGFNYALNETYKLAKPLYVNSGGNIEEGYHSFTKLRIANSSVLRGSRVQRVVKCIIPKGSEYYVDDYFEEYVSDSIIIKEII